MDLALSGSAPTPTTEVIESKIRDFIARNLLYSDNHLSLRNDVSLLEQGVLDSMGVLELVTFASQEFGIDVLGADVTPSNFDSVDRLAAYIRDKMIRRNEHHETST